jgi:hypothetical protein
MSPQDRPKVIALVVAIVLVIGFVVKSFLGAKAAQQAVTTPPASAPSKVDTTWKPTEIDPGPGIQSPRGPVSVAYSGANPFRTVLPDSSTAVRIQGGSSMSQADRAVGRGPKVDGFDFTKLPNTGENGKPFQVDPPQNVLIKVEGVVTGGKKMAVVSVGGETKFLNLGQKFGDGFMVVGISSKAVTFQRNGKRMTVGIGDVLGSSEMEPSAAKTM